jgi:acyl carrier protein
MNEDAKIKEIMANIFGVDATSIREDASKDNIENWDSLRHMDLVLALEEEFGVSIPDEDAANITSFALIRLVLKELKGN